MKKTVFLTGATAGIGLATARLLAKEGFRIILCGRRENILMELAEELSSLTEIHTLSFDVRKKDQVDKAIDSLPNNWSAIDILINNAGNAYGMDFIQDGDIDDWEAMIDINVKGLLYVSKKLMPRMIEKKAGYIINIGSIAGKETYPKGNVYCASKYAVDAISSGMRMDLLPYGIKVSQISPGLVNTEFSKVRFKGDMEKANKVYEGMQPLVGEDIAELILFMVTRPAHVNLADIIILPTAQASATQVHRG